MMMIKNIELQLMPLAIKVILSFELLAFFWLLVKIIKGNFYCLMNQAERLAKLIFL